MRHNERRRSAVCGALMASIQMTTAGLAAAAEDGQGGSIEEIVVTAQKRSEGLQDVPIAVSAFSSDSLERVQIEDATDIQFSIPNAVLTGNERFTLRGIGNNAISSTADNGVGLFVNGASISYPAQTEFFDLERIEVLRGPQGTLYGRNTTGGAINVITRKPTDEFGGDVNLQVGNYDSVRVGGAINLPLGDALSQRFAGYYLERDGYTENEFTGNRIDGRDQYAVRSSTRLAIGEVFEANLVLGYFEEDSDRARETKRLCTSDPVLGCSPLTLGFDSPDANTTILQTLARAFTPFPPGGNIYAGAPNPRDLRAVAADTDPTFYLEQRFGTLDMNWRLGEYTLTSVTGYSKGETEQNTDWDNAALPFRFTAPITYNVDRDTRVTTDQLLTTDSFTSASRSWSQELRLASASDGAFDFTLGAFYLDSEGSSGFEIWHPAIESFQRALGRPPEAWRVNNETPFASTEAAAIFGETYFKLTDQLRLTLGARYTEEEKEIRTRATVLSAIPPFTEAQRDQDKWTGKIALDYAANEDLLLYGSISTGYKGGGLNPGSSGTPEFDDEEVSAVELGAKSTWADGRLQANVAAFYYDYTGLQLAQRIGANAVTSNADATIGGVELELVIAPSDRWLIDANASYLNTSIDDFLTVDAANPAQSLTATSPVVAVNLDGNELPHAPQGKVKLGAQYTLPLGATQWSLTLRGDGVWQDDYFAREFNTPTDVIDSWTIFDAQVRLANSDETLLFRAFCKNLTDEDNITNIIIEDALIGRYRNARVLEPRTYGVIMEYRF